MIFGLSDDYYWYLQWEGSIFLVRTTTKVLLPTLHFKGILRFTLRSRLNVSAFGSFFLYYVKAKYGVKNFDEVGFEIAMVK